MKKQLAAMLRQAAEAHHAYEQQLGHLDENWADWYAQWMADTVQSNGGCIAYLFNPLSSDAATVASKRGDVMAGMAGIA